MASAHSAKGNAVHSNLNVDYVISYRFAEVGLDKSGVSEKKSAAAGFEKLVRALAGVGLATEARNGDNCSVLVFVKAATEKHLFDQVYRARHADERCRTRDWLHGVRPAAPDQETRSSLDSEPLDEAEKLRIVYLLITSPPSEGGAGITPKRGEWECVESIFALHDHTYNKEWIKKWSTSYFLSVDDLDRIRDKFGEKIAFYFAFLQSYFAFLIFPAAFGLSAYVLLGHFSAIYAVVNCLWCVTFVEYWKHQEIDLAVRWRVRGVSSIQARRLEFRHEKEVKDPVTGETVRVFPATKRLSRQLLQIPFAILAGALLGSIIATCFAIEIFISEVYNGPFKFALVYLPTGLLTTLVPTLSTLLTGFATRLTDFENYETTADYDAAMTRKIFVLNFITSYLPIFLTAFVYVPFGSIIVPYLDLFGLTVKPFAENEKQLEAPKSGFEINPARLRKQVIYFTVTAQIVNLALEVIVPYVKRKGFHKVKQMKSQRAAKKGEAQASASINDHEEEASFLARVRNEAELDEYDVTTDLREMCVQFGYLSLFSVVWPLTAVSFLVNNWVELRSDAVKICVEMQRPVPWRADSIGPWLDTLGFLTWLGSLSSAALVYLFSGDGFGPDGTPGGIKGWGLLLAIFFSEHLYFLVRLGVRTALSKMDSPGLQKERAETYMVRKRYLEASLGEESLELPSDDVGDEKISRESLEEEAREQTQRSYGVEDRFWGRQRNWRESSKIGGRIIETSAPSEGKKIQ
ncbi:MAG: hypothetical protein M1833_001188 [Piccolia ochrophora]|nr:MAG: hypothetical protein M1833_001188 [Piccolia ochrophora]